MYDLFDEPGPAPADPRPCPCRSCPGCGAKPGTWAYGRFWRVLADNGYVPLCEDCARIPEVVRDHLHADPDPDPYPCPEPPESAGRVEWYVRRAAAGLAVHGATDWDHLPAPHKLPTGPPEVRHDPGETGIEKCGTERHRARTFWRGRKWPLGVYATEAEAVARVRAFWQLHQHDDRPPPVLWLPCSDEDGALAVEREHLTEWRGWFCGLPERRSLLVVRAYREELKRARVKPESAAVWDELLRRLAAAAGPTLFGTLAEDEEESEYPLGV